MLRFTAWYAIIVFFLSCLMVADPVQVAVALLPLYVLVMAVWMTCRILRLFFGWLMKPRVVSQRVYQEPPRPIPPQRTPEQQFAELEQAYQRRVAMIDRMPGLTPDEVRDLKTEAEAEFLREAAPLSHAPR